MISIAYVFSSRNGHNAVLVGLGVNEVNNRNQNNPVAQCINSSMLCRWYRPLELSVTLGSPGDVDQKVDASS